MFQLIPSLQRVAITATHQQHGALLRSTTTTTPSIIARHLSSSSNNIIPPIPSKHKSATPDQIAHSKDLITNPSNPRSRQHNNRDSRNFPSYRGLPTHPTNPREPTQAPNGFTLYPSKHRYDTGVTPAEMPYLHHRRHDEKPKPKFKNPRKRASKLFHELTTEKVAESKASKPAVWEVPFRVGDAVELQVLDEGGVDNPNNYPLDTIRGVVLGRENKGLDTAIFLKDVLYGEHVERKIKLHSPMVKNLKVLEQGFVMRGKKKGRRVRRAKLYYLRDRKPEETRVSALQK